MKEFKKDCKGVTLVELMIVILVLAIGIIPIASVQTRSNRDVFDSGRHTEALNIAQMQMEQIRSLGFNNAAPDSGSVGAYDWWADIQPVSQGLNTVIVTVEWDERGTTRSVQLNNMLSFR